MALFQGNCLAFGSLKAYTVDASHVVLTFPFLQVSQPEDDLAA